ncbi:MAG: RecQ family ATP-dependent DNA helicase [bacterium]
MKALHAGYVSEAVWKAVQNKQLAPDLDWQDVLTRLSHFVIDHDVGGVGVLPPELAVLENILCRGLPTLPSLYVEKKLERLAGLTTCEIRGDKGYAEYACEFNADHATELKPLLERAFCVVAPEGRIEASPGFALPEFGSGEDRGEFDSGAERTFWNGPLTQLLGPAGMQLVMKQRELSTIAGNGFVDQRTDFSMELPGSVQGQVPCGIVFEVDGPSHELEPNVIGDNNRDNACTHAKWALTYRQRLWQGTQAADPITTNHPGVARILTHPYLTRLKQNVDAPLVHDPLGSRALLLALFPFAVARIQRVILELVRGGVLSFDAPVWHLAIIDRDGLPGCGKTAAKDLRRWLRKLWAIYRPGCSVPHITICEISQWSSPNEFPLYFDAVLDISVQLRYGVTLSSLPAGHALDGVPRVVVRSDYYNTDPCHRLTFSDPLTPQIEGSTLENQLTFFLQNIFRKVDFRQNQTEIIMRALKGESVIALLPTGAGKSLTYQLPVMLQNGMAVVIDPLKALMKDQDDSLKAIGVSCSAFISSAISAKEKALNTKLMQKGCFKFVFVTPERFIIHEFRNALKEIRDQGNVHFAYVVVDEAHCVSEWGHDFRTAYLRLGANARTFCVTRMKTLPFLALTGTASYEVLDDVHTELGYRKDANISVRPEKMGRDNLKYRVVALSPTPVIPIGATEGSVRRQIGLAKLAQVPKVVDAITHTLNDVEVSSFLNADNGSGLVFCPHTKNVHGAQDVCRALQTAYSPVQAKLGVYHGSPGEHHGAAAFDPTQIHDYFRKGKLKVLSCTKAFGMGIDKPDIRFTLHYNIPPSIESFYQEAGRAGRDGKDSQCWILYAGTRMPNSDHSLDYSLNHSFYTNTFPGAQIEETKIFAMLDENLVPGHSALKTIANILFDKTGTDYSIGLHHTDNLHRIYINQDGHPTSKVYVTLNSTGAFTCGTLNPFPNHETVTQLVVDWLVENKPLNTTWEDRLFHAEPIGAGIEKILEGLETGVGYVVCLSFENEYLEKIANAIGKHIDLVRDDFSYAADDDTFVRNLIGFGNHFHAIAAPLQSRIKEVFPKIRLQEHTFRAIYRLTILGAVDDFEVDYKNKTITAWLTPLPRGGYKEKLREYIQRYDSAKVEHYSDIAAQCNYNTELRCCLHALIEFVYTHFAKQRETALTIMEQTTVQGIMNPADFAVTVAKFYDSKYLPFLRPYLHNYTTDLVFERCEYTSGYRVKLDDLLGACNRLLPENPDNAAFHAMRAYAIALMGYPTQDVKSEIDLAVSCFEKYHNWSRRDKLTFLARLRDYVLAVNPASTRAFDTAIIEDHAKWIHGFNMDTGEVMQNISNL